MHYVPDSLARYKIAGSIPWYAAGEWGEILMQQVVTDMGSMWDTWYLMLEDCVLIGLYNYPITEMQNALFNSFACEMNGRSRIVSREGLGRITHETHMENYAYYRKGEYHTRDLHPLPERFESVANDHPQFEQLLGCNKQGKCGAIKGEINVRGRIEWMMQDLVDPYCSPGLIQDYRNSKFSEIITGALWQVDRKDAHLLIKRSSKMRDKAKEAEEFLRSHISEQVPYKLLQQKLQMNIQSLKVAFKEEFGYTMDTYARRLKMETAKLLLLDNPTAEISEVALAVGYGNPRAFSYKFKKHFGYPPSDLQK